MKQPTVLSWRAAVMIGLVLALAGLGVVWSALHVEDSALGAPRALVVLLGVAFLLAGAATTVGYGLAGGATADGQLPPGTPLAVRLIQLTLGLGITGIFAAMAGWIAFGPGERRFGVTVSLPFIAIGDAGNEIVGRIAFGVWAGAAALLFVMFAVAGARHIARAASARATAAAATRERPTDRVRG